MIREFNKKDIKDINEIGSLIKSDFVEKYSIPEILNYEYSKIFVYDDLCIKGFIQIEKHFEIIDIINIAVKEDFQHLGIGEALINFIISNYNVEKIMLEVRESNVKAINFYKKNGFIEINRRKKYYGNEDAIIMERSI